MSDQAEGTDNEQPTELRDSNPNAGGDQRAAGQMGVSSERVGPVGGGSSGTDGEKDTSAARRPDQAGDWVGSDAEGGPEAEGPGVDAQEPEENPEGLDPKAGYPSLDPRSADHPHNTF
ncbi:MAG TPA: hypothetical protein VHW64_18425 [Nocardioides sp.]|jgi:hypothetical protein|uniref:hypothetical protein n=1 Tax=Nocardioides sp. TaxID=35761 RepID=UPI002E2FD7F1|nr:hypothetical protein [Nocardioides sp.]HEX3932678.1 hypothetical protein [Nocardioides sp.]